MSPVGVDHSPTSCGHWAEQSVYLSNIDVCPYLPNFPVILNSIMFHIYIFFCNFHMLKQYFISSCTVNKHNLKRHNNAAPTLKTTDRSFSVICTYYWHRQNGQKTHVYICVSYSWWVNTLIKNKLVTSEVVAVDTNPHDVFSLVNLLKSWCERWKSYPFNTKPH